MTRIEPGARAAALAPLTMRLCPCRWFGVGGCGRSIGRRRRTGPSCGSSRRLRLALQRLSRQAFLPRLLLSAPRAGWRGCHCSYFRLCPWLRLSPLLLLLLPLLLPPPLGSGDNVGLHIRPRSLRLGCDLLPTLPGSAGLLGRGLLGRGRLMLPLLPRLLGLFAWRRRSRPPSRQRPLALALLPLLPSVPSGGGGFLLLLVLPAGGAHALGA